MPTILDLLTDTLLGRLAEAGFEVPQDMTQKQKEAFVLAAFEDAVVLQAHEYDHLVEAARQVCQAVGKRRSRRCRSSAQHCN
ncbi:MAG TPA: hypothetical protein VFK06_17750 [Candidatus Angelobacter sp.]|nr:hypothetical protein [Candidatus Angelobacter sp.]